MPRGVVGVPVVSRGRTHAHSKKNLSPRVTIGDEGKRGGIRAIRHAQTAGASGLWGRLMACRARFHPRTRSVSKTILVSSGTVLIHTPGRENRGVARSVLIPPVDKTGDKRTPPVEQAHHIMLGVLLVHGPTGKLVLELLSMSSSQATAGRLT